MNSNNRGECLMNTTDIPPDGGGFPDADIINNGTDVINNDNCPSRLLPDGQPAQIEPTL